MNKQFNQAQEEAIVHKNGPMMVLAGPGSGKTTLGIELIRRMNENVLILRYYYISRLGEY